MTTTLSIDAGLIYTDCHLSLVDGQYVEESPSQALPIATVEAVETLIAQAQNMGETSWAKSVRQCVRAQLGMEP